MKKALILFLVGLNLVFAFGYSTCQSDEIREAAFVAQTDLCAWERG